MIRLTAIFSVFAVCSTAFCQSQLDSLEAVLKTNPADTVKVDVYLALNATLKDDTTVSMGYLREAIHLSEKNEDRKRLSLCYLRLARICDYAENFSGARMALEMVAAQLHHFQNSKIESGYFSQLGIIDYFEGNYSQAITNLWKAVQLFEEMGELSSAGSCYVNIGNAYKELEERSKALEYYQKALAIYNNMKDEDGAAMAYGNIGNIYRANHQYEDALNYFNKALLVNRKNNRLEDVRIDLNNIGNLFLEKGELAKALPFFHESYDLSKSIGSQKGLIVAGSNIGVIDMQSGKHAAALQQFMEVLQIAKALNYKEDIKDTYELLAITHEQMNQPGKALAFRKEFEQWKDSLIHERYLNEVKKLELKYETDKKNKQIALLSRENEIKQAEVQRQAQLRKAWIVGSLLLLLMAALVLYIFAQRLKNEKILAAKNDEISRTKFQQQLTDLEMKALRAQINPHFLFNCMNSINRMITKGENDRASSYLEKFSRLVRLILEHTETNRVSLENELALIGSYIQMEELRFKGKIAYEISVDESIDKGNTYLPSMVLQPFVENAIWHGLMHRSKNEGGHIKITVVENDDTLVCTIEDNGVGRARSRELRDNSLLKTKSMGIKITEERLKLLSKARISELIHIVDLKDALNAALGTKVEIRIPLA